MEDYFDEYDQYNFGSEYDKMESRMKGHAKHKERKENQRFNPSGNIRKVIEKIQNAEKKEKRHRLNSV